MEFHCQIILQMDQSLIFGLWTYNLQMFLLHRLGNKQDCDGALNENDLQRRLELDTLVDRYKCPCEVVSFYLQYTKLCLVRCAKL